MFQFENVLALYLVLFYDSLSAFLWNLSLFMEFLPVVYCVFAGLVCNPCVIQDVPASQVGILTSTDVQDHAKGLPGMLKRANPSQYDTLAAWHESGVRVVIMSPQHQMGINGLEFIKHVVLYSCPATFLIQLHGRFSRLSTRQVCSFT